MLVQLFVVMNLGIWLSGVAPVLIFDHVSAPAQALPVGYFLSRDLAFFVDWATTGASTPCTSGS